MRRVLLGLVVLASCKPKPATPATPTPLEDVTKAIPATLAPKLKFKEAKLDKATALIPDGWEEGKVIPGSFHPPPASGLGFMTSISIGTNCAGDCVAKDWASAADQAEFAAYKNASKDELLPVKDGIGGRVAVLKGKDQTHLTVVKWQKDAKFYFYCRVSLEEAAGPAVDAFEQACRALQPLSWL